MEMLRWSKLKPALKAAGFKQDRFLRDHFRKRKWWQPFGGKLVILGLYNWFYDNGDRVCWGKTEGSLLEVLAENNPVS